MKEAGGSGKQTFLSVRETIEGGIALSAESVRKKLRIAFVGHDLSSSVPEKW